MSLKIVFCTFILYLLSDLLQGWALDSDVNFINIFPPTISSEKSKTLIFGDFNYQYYESTNKLRQVKPLDQDLLISSGAVTSNTTFYRNITVNGTAYAAAGSTAELVASENVFLDPDFIAEDNADFTARLMNDTEGVFVYDAIGNLIRDHDQDVKISWTPYGKVREVRSRKDSVVVSFLYDGAGNRVYKKVSKPEGTTITHYSRDASGNVMAVYTDTEASEYNIYGSSRLGLYKGGVREAHRTLGKRNFELTNHLGNVLAVITDNVNMVDFAVSATVLKSTDYYAFGLEMGGRTFTDEGYRYGFNGKEKDGNGEFGDTSYDYGFRIYNPRIGRFLSVDPLTKSYPMLTPYQFASNTPIMAIDLDGLEMIYYWTAQKKEYSGLYQALRILNHSGIWSELKKSFAKDNNLTDIYINVYPLPETTMGQTEPQHIQGVPDDGSGIPIYQYEASKDIMDTDNKIGQLEELTENTLSKGKTVIFVHINEGVLKKAASDPEAVKSISLTMVHEILKHAMDLKDRTDDVPRGDEHIEFYNDPDFYEKYHSDYSPPYDAVKKGSEAAKYKERIENTAKSIGIK
jgi:RHS repeat-associated protein